MRQAVFITGFNNWGKTTIIQDLFNERVKFYQGWRYRMARVNFTIEFTVETHSNDDYFGQDWVDHVQDRINNSPDNGENLCSALCPSLEERNNFVELLTRVPFIGYDRIHILLVEYKWEHHARLIIDNILHVGQAIPNANFVVINADQNLIDDNERYSAKILQIRQELNNIFTTP